MKVKASSIVRVVEDDPSPDSSYANAAGYEEERSLIDSGKWRAYGCLARVMLHVLIPGSDPINVPIESPGLWNIYAERLSDPYFDEVFEEEKSTLIAMLRAIGLEVEE